MRLTCLARDAALTAATLFVTTAATGCSSGAADPSTTSAEAMTSSARSPRSTLVFRETFEDGTDRWTTKDGAPIDVEYDDDATHFQRETIATGYGRVFLSTGIPVLGGQTYCVGAYVRGVASLYPFLGVWLSDAAGNRTTEHWLIGMPGTGTGYPGEEVTPVALDGQWRWLTKSFTVEPDASYVVLGDELFAYDGKESGPSADFDDISLYEGACPREAPPRCDDD